MISQHHINQFYLCNHRCGLLTLVLLLFNFENLISAEPRPSFAEYIDSENKITQQLISSSYGIGADNDRQEDRSNTPPGSDTVPLSLLDYSPKITQQSNTNADFMAKQSKPKQRPRRKFRGGRMYRKVGEIYLQGKEAIYGMGDGALTDLEDLNPTLDPFPRQINPSLLMNQLGMICFTYTVELYQFSSGLFHIESMKIS